MQLHHLKPSSARTYPKPRVGRGGKRGTTSGRGTKGQRSRSGHRIRPAERDLIQRLPKLRGSRSRRAPHHAIVAVTLRDVARAVKGPLVNPDVLRAARLIGRAAGAVKIIAGGALDRALTFEGVRVSKGAREAITAAGGRVIANNTN